MDTEVRWIKYHEPLSGSIDYLGLSYKTLYDAEESDATHVIISKEHYQILLGIAGGPAPDAPKKQIKIGYSIQCPDCGFVQSGFETEEEAVAWDCSECQPTLPGMDLPIG